MVFRGFIAVEVPVSQELEDFSGAVKGTGADLKMVSLTNIHLTLKFLGDTPEELVPDIKNIIRDSVQGIDAFTMELKGAGTFPNLNRISVVWAGLENSGTLGDIAGRIDAGLIPLGFSPEKKFSPHVTIARVKTGRNREVLARIIRGFSDTDFGEVPVDRIILKKSMLTPRGPVYSDIVDVIL